MHAEDDFGIRMVHTAWPIRWGELGWLALLLSANSALHIGG
jgi:hypothetical protein